MKKTFLARPPRSRPPSCAGTALARRRPARTPGSPSSTWSGSPAESLLGKSYAAQLEKLAERDQAEGTKKQTELGKLDAAIKALQDELEKQGSVLSPEAADKKRQEIVKKTRERQAFLEDGQADLQRMQERAQQQAQVVNNEFQVKIKPAHRRGGEGEGHRHPARRPGRAAPSTRDFDISRDVIVKADDAERAAKAKPRRRRAAPSGPKPARAAQAVAARSQPSGAPALRPCAPRRPSCAPPPCPHERSIDIGGSSGRSRRQYPFVLVDRVLEHDPAGRLVAVKNVTGSEDFFDGHFPGAPVMPGVLLMESLAQAAGIWLLEAAADPRALEIQVVGIDEAKFRRPVGPGRPAAPRGAPRAPARRPRAASRARCGSGEPAGGRGAPAPAGRDPARRRRSTRRPGWPRGPCSGPGCGWAPTASSGPQVRLGRGHRPRRRTWSSTATPRSARATTFFPFASIGLAPQDLKYRGEADAARDRRPQHRSASS